ncbi:MAG: hypothetical protein ACK40O_12415, partial [Allosphingosinicella sp.]
MIKKSAIYLASLGLGVAALGVPAAAQEATASAGISAGMTVKHPESGTDVGTVARLEGGNVIVKTDRYEVPYPAESFTVHEGALLFGFTRDQVNAAYEQALAEANAKLVPGAAVSGAAGTTVGTIEAIDGQYVTLKLNSGKSVRLERRAVGAGANGVVTSL